MRETTQPYCEHVFEGSLVLCGSNALNVIDGKSYCDHHAKLRLSLKTRKLHPIACTPDKHNSYVVMRAYTFCPHFGQQLTTLEVEQ